MSLVDTFISKVVHYYIPPPSDIDIQAAEAAEEVRKLIAQRLADREAGWVIVLSKKEKEADKRLRRKEAAERLRRPNPV